MRLLFSLNVVVCLYTLWYILSSYLSQWWCLWRYLTYSRSLFQGDHGQFLVPTWYGLQCSLNKEFNAYDTLIVIIPNRGSRALEYWSSSCTCAQVYCEDQVQWTRVNDPADIRWLHSLLLMIEMKGELELKSTSNSKPESTFNSKLSGSTKRKNKRRDGWAEFCQWQEAPLLQVPRILMHSQVRWLSQGKGVTITWSLRQCTQDLSCCQHGHRTNHSYAEALAVSHFRLEGPHWSFSWWMTL